MITQIFTMILISDSSKKKLVVFNTFGMQYQNKTLEIQCKHKTNDILYTG